MNAKQLSAIITAIDEAISDVFVEISDVLAGDEVEAANSVIRRTLTRASDCAFDELYNMLSEEQQKEYNKS